MTVAHANVSAANIHECKGANAASVDTVRISDGAGSGSWAKVPPASITGLNNKNLIMLTASISDISTPASHWVVTPTAGIITKIYTVIDNAITVANAVLSFEIAGVAVTNGGITIAYSGSAAGDVDSSTPSGARTLTAGQALEIITDGGSTDACRALVTILIDVS